MLGSVVKRPGTSVPSRHKKLKTSLYKVFFMYRVPGQLGSVCVGPYDFREAETADGILKSSYKNGIYSLTQNVTEFESNHDMD